MTSQAIDFALTVSGTATCERAIEAQARYLKSISTPPEDLTAELDDGYLDTSGTRTDFRFCTPNESLVKVFLVEGEDGWLVDSVSAGGAFFVDADDRKHVEPCRVPRG